MKNSLELLERERELALAELVKFSENREYYDEKRSKNSGRILSGWLLGQRKTEQPACNHPQKPAELLPTSSCLSMG